MPIPDFQTIMLPLLTFARDGAEHTLRETIDALAEEFQLTVEERNTLLPSGQQAVFDNRVGWARTYLKKAGLLESTRRGYYRITDRGQQVLRQNPPRIDSTFLRRFPEFIEFQRTTQLSTDDIRNENEEDSKPRTPEETIETAYQKLRESLTAELLQLIKERSPSFFERLVIDLLIKMGYGGTRKDAGEALGKTGDGGIDGIIKEDRLGLDIIYIQAKRWDNVVGRPEIQKFAGALQGQRARKGVFITTSTFSQEALDFASRIDSKIVLIDGSTLAQLMIDHNVGVTTVAAYELKRVDSDYFTEE
ncbi:MAG: restriction endonuclease [Chloroflexus sp.]|nr:MAG: restriction endonuclease [Chloroflexus sp.]